MEILNKIGSLGIVLFVLSSMAAIGLGHSLRQIFSPLRNRRLLTATLVANFLLLPGCSFALALGLRLEEPLADGLILLGAASGAPFVPKLTELAKGDLEFAIAATVMLTAGTIIYVPIVLPLLVPDVEIDPWIAARPLLLFMLLPLALGLAVKASYKSLAAKLNPVLHRISNISFLPVIVLVSALNVDNILHILGTRGMLAAFLLVFIGLGAGWLCAGPGNEKRRVLSLTTGLRNFAVAIVVANQSFDDPRVEIMVIVAGIVALLVVLPLCLVWGRLVVSPLYHEK